ncbi:MAG: hypothetical protein HY773_01875, partial [Candidatus Terrybacteria bacterium]|nr:hypothetical protein [Candidatus Terrybacteria bacterium]
MSRNKNLISVILSVVLSIMVVAAAASAATTISTNISTDGTLTVVGNASLATITAGTWNGTAIGVAYGGTGAATAAAARTNLGLGTMAVEANTGSTTITTLGTIATGVWSGTAIGAQVGGTGQNFSASSGLINLYSGTASAIATSSLGLLTTDVAEGTNQYWTNT